RALEDEAKLTLLGRLMARAENARILATRLRVAAFAREHPEIARERVAAPLFVTGLARTGTSLLLELLWRDAHNPVPLTSEMIDPVSAARAPAEDPPPAFARAHGALEAPTH